MSATRCGSEGAGEAGAPTERCRPGAGATKSALRRFMRETLARKAYDALRMRISRGELPPGTRLVNRTLAHDLGVSFTPVREAINQLASDGLVEYVRGGGAFVRKVDRADLAQLYDLRENLEPFAAAEAAEHITKHELDELQEICDDWRSIAHDIRERGVRENSDRVATYEQALHWSDNETRFHLLLISAARNRWLTKIAGDLFIASQAFARVRQEPEILTLGIAAATWRGHIVLLRALRKRDPDAARKHMLRHIQVGRRYVLESARRMKRKGSDGESAAAHREDGSLPGR